jgi:hypothetical protein
MSCSLKSFKFAAKLRKLIEVMKKKGDLFLLASQQHRKSYRQIIAKVTVKLSQKLPLKFKIFHQNNMIMSLFLCIFAVF